LVTASNRRLVVRADSARWHISNQTREFMEEND
jgi:hypothetical protein